MKTCRFTHCISRAGICLAAMSLLCSCSQSKMADAESSSASSVPPQAVGSIAAGQVYDEALTPDLNDRASSLFILPGNKIKFVTRNGMSESERDGTYCLQPGNVMSVHYDGQAPDAQALGFELKSGMLISQQDDGHYLLRTAISHRSTLPPSPESQSEQ